MNQKLNYEQNLRAAVIFLNVFGLQVEETIMEENNYVRIFNALNIEVGRVSFDQDVIRIAAQSSFGELTAEYEYANVSGLEDYATFHSLVAYFAEWSSNIKYTISGFKKTVLSGEFLIRNSMDTELGNKCLCHPLIKFSLDDGSSVTIKFLRDGKTFAIDYKKGGIKEWVYMTPFDHDDVAMNHGITNLNKSLNVFDEYNKRAIVRKDLFSDNISTLRYEIIKDKPQYYEEKLHEEVEEKQLVIQKGLLMQEIDPELYDALKRLKEYLRIGGVSLLDNLIAVSLTSYSDEEVKALFGFERVKIKYQNDAADLVDAYFSLVGRSDNINSSDNGNRSIFLLSRKNGKIES